MSPRLELALDGDGAAYHPGDWVRGHVRILEGGKSRALNVTLRYREKSPDYSATAHEIPSRDLHTGDLTAGQSYEFAVQLPADALPNLSSSHGALWWEVEARSDEFGIDSKTEQRINVSIDRSAAAAASQPATAT